MIKILTQIPERFSLLKRLAMMNIHIKRDDNNDSESVGYTNKDAWMAHNIDMNIMCAFV